MYEKVNWTDGKLLTPARFRQMETQYEKVIEYWKGNSFKALTNKKLRVEVLASAPSHAEGRIYFDSGDNEVKVSDGTAWSCLLLEDS